MNNCEWLAKQSTEDLLDLIDEHESVFLELLCKNARDVKKYEWMFSLAKRELSLRGVLQTIKFEDEGDSNDDGYNDGYPRNNGGDPSNWWKP